MTQEEMEEYWRPLGNIRSVRLRRFPNSRDFKVGRHLLRVIASAIVAT